MYGIYGILVRTEGGSVRAAPQHPALWRTWLVSIFHPQR
jgi:hypothetical protein